MKKITHVLALGVAALYGFILTPAGLALAHQYKLIGVAFAGIMTIAALYHQPKA